MVPLDPRPPAAAARRSPAEPAVASSTSAPAPGRPARGWPSTARSSRPTSNRSRSRSTASCHPAADVVACDARRLPFADASFDAVLCVTVLCHRSIESPVAAVGEMARVVRPGGLVCLWEPGVRRLRRAHDRVTHTGRRFSRRDLAELLTANGLTLERSTGAYSFLVPPAAVEDRARTRRHVERPRPQRQRPRRRPAGGGDGRASPVAPRQPAVRPVGRGRRGPREARLASAMADATAT